MLLRPPRTLMAAPATTMDCVRFTTIVLKLARTPDQQGALRRGLIPVLTRMKDYAAAVDEYVAILNQFSEDEALAGEAARYARKYGQADRLTAFYSKAMSDSPATHDGRPYWLEFRHRLKICQAAIESYSKALAIRPDRSDLLASRAGLEERLLRFEDAAKSYAKLYELAYKDPQFMVKVAENRARLGQKGLAIDALRTAFLEGRAAKADAFLEIAARLEQWNWLPEARQYAADGRKLDAAQGVALEARIAARLRNYTAINSEEGLQAVGQVVREFYTPEEKTAFATWLMRLPLENKTSIALTAGLQDVAVRDLHRRITSDVNRALDAEGQQLIQLEQQRLAYAELAAYLEGYSKSMAQRDPQAQLLTSGCGAVEAGGESTRRASCSSTAVPAWLRARSRPIRATAVHDCAGTFRTGGGRQQPSSTRRVDHAAYRAGDFATASRIIGLRGANMPAVWPRAYTALTGVYFNNREPVVMTAFQSVLGPRTIGEQIAARADRDQQAVGDVWFYYGARYGEFTNSEDYLASELEGRPASASPYATLGDYYRESKADEKALDEYSRALQLDPSAADVHNSMAEIYAAQKKHGRRRWNIGAKRLRLWSEIAGPA